MQAKSKKNLEWVLKASNYVYESRPHDQLKIKNRFYETTIMFCYLIPPQPYMKNSGVANDFGFR